MERLTHERVNGIKTGYWSAATKEVLVQKLAAYENTGYEPDEIRAAIEQAAKNSISTHAPLAGRDSKRVQITMHIFAITDKFQMLLHRMPPVRAFCSFLMQENHADFGCEPPK